MKHRPELTAVMGPKHEDDAEVQVAEWDGTIKLSCTCGWSDSRIYASVDQLTGAWSEHMTADTYGMQHRS